MKFLNYILRFVRREIQNNKRFTILFILNLSLGLTGFIALDGFKESLDRTIKTRSKGILGADFGISARRPILENELESVKEKLPQSFEESKMIELYSMVSNLSGRSKLMQLKAIESNFPFYGEIELNQPSKSKDLENTAEIWVYEDILHLLKVKLGDKLRIGTQEFSISRVVTRDSAAGVSTNMAPRIYLHINQLMKTGLIRPGSVAWHSYVFKIPYNDSEELNRLRDGVFKSLPTQDIRVYTHENTSQQMTRMLSRLNDFLGLTSLVALFLAALGSGFLFRSYFKKKIKEIAILISLGMSKEKSYAIYLTQIMTLGFLSSLLATVLSLILVPGLGEVTKSLLPFPIEFSINLQTVLLGILVGTLGSFLICLPV
ncbi:ABC transporter permease, partial [Bacteriovorax sp. DB6_IX]|uniref:ABC transporter permease n=1 Tax=Bacteriovorax sp. DB6_IX TaxID=1353530 RepID=UPI00038A1DB1